MKRFWILSTLTTVAFSLPTVSAQTSTDDEIRSLKERLLRLEQPRRTESPMREIREELDRMHRDQEQRTREMDQANQVFTDELDRDIERSRSGRDAQRRYDDQQRQLDDLKRQQQELEWNQQFRR